MLHSFERKTKVSYYITFFQTQLRPFSCDLCYSDRRNILSYFQKKESNLLRLQEEQYIPFNEQEKCRVTNIYTVEENKSIILHSFARKTKVSYYITFVQTQLRPFSCDLCYSDRRIILSYYEESNLLCLQEEQYIPFNEQQKCLVTNIYTGEEKQKYHITFFCEKNKSIVLHHVLS